MIDEVEEREKFDLSLELERICLHFFLNTVDEDADVETFSYIDNRILNIEKNSVESLFKDHVIVIGFQDTVNRLAKLINCHFVSKKICIILNEHQTEQHFQIAKLMNRHNKI